MNPSTSLGTRSKVGMAKPSPPIRQAGNIWHLLVIRGVCRRSLRSAYAHVNYRCRCRVRHQESPSDCTPGLIAYIHACSAKIPQVIILSTVRDFMYLAGVKVGSMDALPSVR